MKIFAIVALVIAALAAAPETKAAQCVCRVHIAFLVDINSIVVSPQFTFQLRVFMHASLTAAIQQAQCDDVSIVIIEFDAAAHVVAWITDDPKQAIDGYTPTQGTGTTSNVEAAFDTLTQQFASAYMLKGDRTDSNTVVEVITGKRNDLMQSYNPCSLAPGGLQCDNAEAVYGDDGEVSIAVQILMQIQAGLYVFCPKPTTTTELPEITTLPPPMPPADKCFQCRMRRNHKDLYDDETDCHYYYQCFYVNETFAIGYRRKCADGLFWHDPILSCMPEGEVPCSDRCLTEDATAARGCYAGSGCRQYFVCSNTGSYGMCCPEGSSFNAETCGCDEAPTCNDFCVQRAPQTPTTVAPATQVNATVCIDSFGSAISTVPGEANAYVLIAEDGSATDKSFCQAPLLFDLLTCRCNIVGDGTTAAPSIDRKAILYLTFDDDLNDKSVYAYKTFLFGNAERDTSSAAATGAGSLSVTAGHVEVPGLKTYDFGQSGSWCAFYRGSGVGGILGNNKDSASSEYTAIFATQSTTSFIGKFKFWQPIGDQNLQSAFSAPAGGWNHFCATYDGNALRLYLNGQNVQTQFVGGYLSVAHCPYVVGHDQELGYFEGSIDEVLMTPFAMTVDEINAHRTGNRAFLEAQGFF